MQRGPPEQIELAGEEVSGAQQGRAGERTRGRAGDHVANVRAAVARFGPRLGCFVASVTYRLGWGGVFSSWVVGAGEVGAMFGPARPRFGRPGGLGAAFVAVALSARAVVGAACGYQRLSALLDAAIPAGVIVAAARHNAAVMVAIA